jgi:PAS domain S-box-containing protein
MPQMKDVYLVILSAIAAEKTVDFTELGANACIAKGPFNKMSEHVLDVLDRLDQKVPNDVAKKIIGLEDVHPREITKELLSSKRHSEAILDNVSEGIVELNLEQKIIYVNRFAHLLIGIREEELLGSNFNELFGDAHQMRVKELMDLIDDGPQKISEDLPLILKGKQVSLNIMPINDEMHSSIIVILNDISRRKQIEDRLQQAQKLESVGILAGGIAHDFNNLLSIIMGNISLAKDDIKPGVGVSEILNEAEKASLLARDLTKQLVTFSKGGAPVKELSYISKLIEKATNFALSGSNVGCQFNMPDDLWPVEIDQGQIRHVINNVVINAVQAMPEGGTIEVCAENFMIGSDKDYEELSLQDGKYVKILFRDQGTGISDKDLPMIFDPYYSSKERGTQKGMGLGLATSYSIIKKHNGGIIAKSKLGVGTTINIYLPASEIEASVKRKLGKKAIPGEGRILVMDDEEMVRNMTGQMLNRLGYEVEFSKDGDEAVAYYRESIKSTKPFDTVILDLTIRGGMGGKKAIQKLIEIDPDVKGIVSSGHSEDPVMTDFGKYGFCSAIAKPYSMPELSVILDKVITDTDVL